MFLSRRLFQILAVLVALFVAAYTLPWLLGIAQILAVALAMLVAIDAIVLLRVREAVDGTREMAARLSNGDDNRIRLHLHNRYGFPIDVDVIDELPFQFQIRDFRMRVRIASGATAHPEYSVRPVQRGEYDFGSLNLYVSSPIGLAVRRFRLDRGRVVAVYPSYVQLRRYELMAHSHRLADVGVRRVRRVGHTMEFDQIRDYVVGDDYRTVNWKATARHGGLMVNQYQDERSQRVYAVIDKGRAMQMPFEGMTLLDHAINATLLFSNVVVNRGDRAGLVTFSRRVDTMVPAERRRAQMHRIVEMLYNQDTDFSEPNYELLFATIRRTVTTRSLVMLYTNFETLQGLRRQLPYLRGIAATHLVVVVFFENTELRGLLEAPAATTGEIYRKAIAEQFALEKKQIVGELKRHGIHAILTTPANLTIDSINKYLEIKARRLI